MHLIRYSMADGLDWDAARIDDDRDRRTVEQALRTHNLLEIATQQNEVVRVLRGISSLSRTPTTGLKFASGEELTFCFLLEFGEHLAPTSAGAGQTEAQTVAIELAHITAQSLSLRTSRNLVVIHAREGMVDPLVCCALKHIRLPQPDELEKREFVTAARKLYSKAVLADELTQEDLVNLSIHTPNRSTEALLRASHLAGVALTASEVAAQKHDDVEQMSEGTLRALDTTRISDLKLVGTNIETPLRVMQEYGSALLRRDSAMPTNVLLVGPPGTGKTDLAVLTAKTAKAPAFEMLSPKGGIVGETERKARLQQVALKEWGGVAFVDEITEAFPMQRVEFDGDNGASRAVTAALLTSLSDESRRGKSLLIATTNAPWRICEAMRSRFTVIPVLHPSREDYPRILCSIAHRISAANQLDVDDQRIVQAADLFFRKGANPREIRGALSRVSVRTARLTPETVLFAAEDLCCAADINSVVYAELWAIRVCSSRSFLPWTASPSSFPYPTYLQEIVDRTTGRINYDALNKRIKELQPYANV
jgi:DNA polymerase III delta prime subunit